MKWVNALHSRGDMKWVNPLHSLRYVHSCLELIRLILTSTNNPSRKSVVLECSAKPSLRSPGLISQMLQEPLTQGANLLGVVGVNIPVEDICSLTYTRLAYTPETNREPLTCLCNVAEYEIRSESYKLPQL